ncbi:MAG: thiamine phosphate synthase [Aestuariivirga sp.]|uniref:thiamine phosphate synthase n=1 Tax=Aestuariivirga sp. TaxID=2650926 RepID=UPI0025BD76B3|nr:thiamine phosphate synthase [Aestuariivirga sp.]MCA3561225.1 thiamine phosphate synthase [Aestuariivirga sp.]
MNPPRLFLVAPGGVAATQIIACLKAACQAGDVASLLVSAALAKEVTKPAQDLGVAVMVSGEARDAARAGADGIQVEAGAEAVAAAREQLGKDRFVGAYAGASRHFAMEAAEAGADYIAFDQTGASAGGEPIIRWWSDMMEIPCVAFTPVEPAGLDILLPQKPDFIRPSGAMWQGADDARRIVSALMQRLG